MRCWGQFGSTSSSAFFVMEGNLALMFGRHGGCSCAVSHVPGLHAVETRLVWMFLGGSSSLLLTTSHIRSFVWLLQWAMILLLLTVFPLSVWCTMLVYGLLFIHVAGAMRDDGWIVSRVTNIIYVAGLHNPWCCNNTYIKYISEHIFFFITKEIVLGFFNCITRRIFLFSLVSLHSLKVCHPQLSHFLCAFVYVFL